MDILINERSFVGQATAHTATDLMRQLAETIDALRPSLCGDRQLVHSTLAQRRLTATLTLFEWLFNQHDPRVQSFRVFLIVSLRKGPFVDTLLDMVEHLCEYNAEDATGSSIAGAAHLGGVLVSLSGCANYIDAHLTVLYVAHDGSVEQRAIRHFVTPQAARRSRRRYVPNPKHHPTHAHGDATAMPLDTAYDPMDDAKQARLRDFDQDLPDTEAQRLLDCAEPGGKQFYARSYEARRRVETFYEFQDDNAGGFHGYPVPESQVPSEVLRRLRSREA